MTFWKALGAGLAVTGVACYNSIYYIDSGFIALTDEGFKYHGFHYRLPGTSMPPVLEINPKRYGFSQSILTRDKKREEVEVEIFLKPEVESLPSLYKNYGQHYIDEVVPQIIDELSKIHLTQVDTNGEVQENYRHKSDFKQELTDKLKNLGIATSDIKILGQI